ncbi:winged helix-turn-helix transcriptional regulator [Geobacter pickeringii]|uniref:Endonuclease III n=1 Tax=Geobacter pickeringii TaxID=345632 RepID=A0A0B5BGX7_9BACT|nr:winged helix-turn-helix transcriptional regulator [Geobacter pickeringii]AJE03296.1 endonuclease III [Geobacter pickeringii]
MTTERISRLGHLFRQERLSTEVTDLFREIINDHYRENARILPWRSTFDPYAIYVSEVMLQQTQVERVRVKYEEFLARFPDITTLAGAPLHEVLAVWQGLGYNRRAVLLKKCAETLMERFNGTLPSAAEALETLPGIGHYTARAIAAFAFGAAAPFIETNIRTVFIHLFLPDRDRVHDREILPLVEGTIDHTDPRRWYYALMDYGAHLKRTHVNPSRRSAHHTRQAPFKGSNRELRSRILRAVMAQPGISGAGLADQLDTAITAVIDNLQQMESEGLITLQQGLCRIP